MNKFLLADLQLQLETAPITTMPTEADAVDAGAPPEHLVILCHGLHGSPGSVQALSHALHLAHGFGNRLLIHLSLANFTSIRSTHSGVAAGGERLASEIEGLVAKYPSLKRISLMGFSLGGLYIRAAAPLIEHLGLAPVNFVAVASPHAGIRGHLHGLVERTVALGVLGDTGRDLLLLDSRGEGGAPLLVWMADPRSPHWRALSRYPNRVVAANVLGDDKVPYHAAALAAHPGILRALS